MEPGPQKRLHLQRALNDPDVAVILTDTVLDASQESEGFFNVLEATPQAPRAPIVITHVCGSALDLPYAASKENQLRAAGIIVAPSNAAAAYLAGSLTEDRP
jgi:hypothetical protein